MIVRVDNLKIGDSFRFIDPVESGGRSWICQCVWIVVPKKPGAIGAALVESIEVTAKVSCDSMLHDWDRSPEQIVSQ